MKTLIPVLIVAVGAAGCASLSPVEPQSSTPPVTVSKDELAATIFFTSCHLIVAAAFIDSLGHVKWYDKTSAITAENLKDLANKAAVEPRAYELGCFHETPDIAT